MVNDGSPVDTCTSTEIGCPCTPTRVAESTFASTVTPRSSIRSSKEPGRRLPSAADEAKGRV